MSALAILRAETLHLYYSDRVQSVGGSFSKTAVSDMDVLSDAEIAKSVIGLVPVIPNTIVSTILVLSEELCFVMPFDGQKQEDVEKKLSALTPFARVAMTNLTIQSHRYMIATNQDLYDSVCRALVTRGHPVISVVPWTLLVQIGITKGEIDMVTVKRAFDNLATIKASAFPLAVAVPTIEKVATISEDTKIPKKKPWGLITFGVIAFVYAIIMYVVFIR